MGQAVPLGRYLLDRRLAVGGMAEVFLGRLPGAAGFEKPVVIKRILPIHKDNQRFAALFISEARVLARLAHPNLVEVFGFEVIDGQYCLIMEYVEGHDLRALIRESSRLTQPIPPAIAAFLIAEAAAGLHAAHVATDEGGVPLNVVHRDISPENIIVSSHGRIKIVDFGVAKHEQSIDRTPSGSILGKAAYMSPEQARGENAVVDHTSDIYALGVVLYELLTGTSPFRRGSLLDTIAAATHPNVIPVSNICPEVPPELEGVIRRMMAPVRSERYGTADDAAGALNDWLRSKTSRPAEDTREFTISVFSKTVITSRVHYPGLEDDEVPITGELIEPGVQVTTAAYQDLRSNRSSSREGEPARNDKTIQLGRGAQARLAAVGAGLVAMTDEETRPSRQPFLRSKWQALSLAFLVLAVAAVSAAVVVRIKRSRTVAPAPVASPMALPVGPPASPTRAKIPGALEIASTPAGASIYFDGRLVAEQTPTTIADIERDVVHEVVVSKPGYQVVSRPLKLTEKDGATVSWFLTLAEARTAGPVVPSAGPPAAGAAKASTRAKTGTLTFDGVGVGQVVWHGKSLGRPPLKEVRLPVGSQTLDLKTSDYGLTKSLQVEILPGEPAVKAVSLGKGKLALDVRPWAVVYVCGKKLGLTPLPPLELYEGTCTVKLTNPDLGVVREVPLTVRPGAVTRIIENLQ